MLSRLLREPLVHFLGLGMLIFVGYTAVSGGYARPDQIVITEAKIEQLAALFAKTWQRQPTKDELKGIIDDYVKEEVYYREALALNLERDDPVVRRRLRLKMEVMDGTDAVPVPDDGELAVYLKRFSQEFVIPSEVSFEQVYLNPTKRGAALEGDVQAVQAALLASAPIPQGDSTLLPPRLLLASEDEIERQFGPDFTKAISDLPIGKWASPIRSEYGLHFVQIQERRAERMPSLEEVRGLAVRKWQARRRAEIKENRFQDVLKRYEIYVETSAP